MPDSTYTITRYDYPLLGGVAAHGYYALERTDPGGTTTPIAALHGMATDANNIPQPIGLPWDNHTIKVHQFQNPKESQDGIVQIGKVRNGKEYDPVWPDSIRRGDLGQMTRQQATDTYNRMLRGGAAINDKEGPYAVTNTNSNTAHKHLGELARDPAIGRMGWDGSSPGWDGELNKPGYGQRILSPEEIRAIDPDAPIVSYPTADPLGLTPTPRSVIFHPDKSRIETDSDGLTTKYDASGKVKTSFDMNLPATNGPAMMTDAEVDSESAMFAPRFAAMNAGDDEDVGNPFV